jgi:hypothetical protein
MEQVVGRLLSIFGNNALKQKAHLHERGVKGAMMLHHMRETMGEATANDNAETQYHRNMYVAKQYRDNRGDVARKNNVTLAAGLRGLVFSHIDYNYAYHKENTRSMTKPGADLYMVKFDSNSQGTMAPVMEMKLENVGPRFVEVPGSNIVHFYPSRPKSA